MVFNHNTMMKANPPFPPSAQDSLKGRFEYDTISLTPLIIDSTLTSDSVLRTSFIRPACRGICISYNRPDSNSAITSVYAKWYNCGNACCEIISSFCNVEHLTNIPPEYLNDGRSARIDVEVNYSGDCGTTPDSVCTIVSLNTQVTRFKDCRDYCQAVDGIDPFGLSNFDKNQTGVYKLNDNPVFSDKFISQIPDNILLESSANDLEISVSNDVTAIKLVTLSGNVLKTIAVKPSMNSINMSLNSVSNGLYLLIIESNGRVISKPLIIAK